MSTSGSPSNGDWCSASVPVALSSGMAIDANLRSRLVDFLRDASNAKLKPAQLATQASAMVEAWVSDEGKPDAPE